MQPKYRKCSHVSRILILKIFKKGAIVLHVLIVSMEINDGQKWFSHKSHMDFEKPSLKWFKKC